MKLSIITINLNNSKGLHQTLRSVAEQVFRDYEYIVIDGGSTDESLDVIKQYEDKITYWESKPDKGIYHAMNKGILKARGEYCLFLNSGDWLVDDQVLVKVFQNDLVEDIVYGNINLINSQNHSRMAKIPDNWNFRIFLNESLPHPTSFIKRDLFFEIGLYNESYKIISDWEFFVLAIVVHHKTYKHVPVCVTNFRYGGISNTNVELVIEETRNALSTTFLPFLPEAVIILQREINEYQNSRIIKLYRKLLNNKILQNIYNFIFR